MTRVHCVLVAAGSGTRLGARGPKALVELGGEPLLVHALRGLALAGVLDSVIVVAPVDRTDHVRGLASATLAEHGYRGGVDVTAGGATRQASVVAGLAALDTLANPDDDDVVLVHDAARCLTPTDQVRRVVDAVRAGHGAVVPAVPVTDTLKRVADPVLGGVEPVVATVDRSELRAVQTPQGFTIGVLRSAHETGAHRAGDEALAASDDAGLVEALGGPVAVVAGSTAALKVTTPFDLRVAELVLADRGGAADGAGAVDGAVAAVGD
ncbi:2-C-methyl-D-erythritol 4-phosphate cytidylyltransferase [Georgenia sp. Z1344]|uniref:2-C-methyl-D-erythritol 4-phosphate cytidylyltransferase n=1 Tax=Georgenia sp. Z1344 TaxID=3416706 RepID=UPI003CEA5063